MIKHCQISGTRCVHCVHTQSIPHYSPLWPTASATAKATASTTARAAASGDRRAASEECRAAVSGGCGTAAPDSEEEEDEFGDVTQIFVKTDEGRTSALQVTSRDTTGECGERADGRSSTRGAGTCSVKGGCSGVRTSQEVAEWRMETCCS